MTDNKLLDHRKNQNKNVSFSNTIRNHKKAFLQRELLPTKKL